MFILAVIFFCVSVKVFIGCNGNMWCREGSILTTVIAHCFVVFAVVRSYFNSQSSGTELFPSLKDQISWL